jgi:lipoyl-dependent peroxiredoxin subunit D
MLDELKDALPDHAKDLKLNLSSVLSQPALSDAQVWGTALASAIASRNPRVLRAIAAEAEQRLSPENVRAAKGAAAIMGMNNIYYRFTHAVAAKDYASMRAGLRMNIIANHGVSGLDFELWSLAVSAINGCAMCMESHERAVSEKGVTPELVQAVVKIAAVVHAVAVTLEAEDAVPAAVQAAAA